MRRLPNSPLFIFIQYLLAVLLVGLTTGVLDLLRSGLNAQIEALLYLVPVGISTAWWGLGPGIGGAFTAFLAFNYFFIEPYHTLLVHQPQDVLMLFAFLVIAVVISQLLGRARNALDAATERERDAIRLYELSTALAGQHDERSIARTIAQHTIETFRALRVEVNAEADRGAAAVNFVVPIDAPPLTARPTIVIPLLTVRGLQGEIRVWRGRPALAATEERLLKTFASQGALALERARLARLENRARVAEESDRMKTALLSSVSHELRTPLAAMKAAVTSLRSGAVGWDTEARQELLATIEEETDHLNQLVGNLLDMSRIEAGALKPIRKWNVLAEIIGDVVVRMKPLTKRHRIVVKLQEDLPLVPIDYVQLQQVFTNLISNGLKYAPPGTPIRIEAQASRAETVQVKVTNKGPRVPDEHLERIFDKFYRITNADRVTGTGLGLSICKGIIEAHGGRIWAENLPDGLAFNFTLPLIWNGQRPPRPLEQD
jgi:two-component system sensor histidine kinase KdpD